jgi:toxin ParE1/3/4
MTIVRLSRQARADVEEIWSYTARRWSEEQAARYIGEIKAACKDLADGVRQGRPIDVADGYLKLPVRSHFVIYRLTQDGDLDVVRILHQRMDVPERLQ